MKIQSSPLRTVLSNYNSVHNYFGWPTVARLRDGRLAVAVSGFRLAHMCLFGKSVVTFSEDDGETWSAPSVVFDTLLDDRDSGLCPFGDSGLLVTTFNDGPDLDKLESYIRNLDGSPLLYEYAGSYLNVLRSRPDRDRFAGSLYRISLDNGRTFGPIRTSPVSCPHGPVLRKDGSFLYVGNSYVYRDGDVRPSGSELECWRITPDGGQELLGKIPSAGEGLAMWEPHPVLLPDGKILVHIRVQCADSSTRAVFTVWQSESCDGGRTFTKPHPIGVEQQGGSPPHLLYHDGLLISTYAHRAEPHQLRAAFSLDGGETWDCDNVITALPDPHADFGYASSVVRKDGSILTVYYGGDPDVPDTARYAGDGKVYEYPVPVVRSVVWRYSPD